MRADPKLLRMVMQNLLSNSVKYTPIGGKVALSITLADKKHIQIEVSDTGYGISPKDISHIFDPFFSKKDHGTGLGLSITHEIIKNHNGKILVESELGKKTSFRIELPLQISPLL